MEAHQIVPLIFKVIQCATEAAAEHVDIARHRGEEPDTDGGMGLHQYYHDRFHTEAIPGETRDIVDAVFWRTYEEAVKAIAKATEPKAA